MNAKIVIGLTFGDEGKGLVTDYLCSTSRNPIVVRFSGGQQCGHTVMVNGKKHVHSNFGSGTLRGIPSYFSEHTSFYLPAMVKELELLRSLDVYPKLYIHPLAKVTTPYDVAWNRATCGQSSSCGLGIAATMKRHNETPSKLFAVDTLHKDIFEEKLYNIQTYYLRKASEEDIAVSWPMGMVKEFKLFRDLGMFEVADYEVLLHHQDIIFEGSQGIMLDMDHGIFPDVTYAHTTSRNAMEICDKLRITQKELYYVTRCYQTRHGNGWMSNESPVELINNEEEINIKNQWQGKFRIGEFDYDLINHSLKIDEIYADTTHSKHLVITCLDQRPSFIFDEKKITTKMDSFFYNNTPKAKLQEPSKIEL